MYYMMTGTDIGVAASGSRNHGVRGGFGNGMRTSGSADLTTDSHGLIAMVNHVFDMKNRDEGDVRLS